MHSAKQVIIRRQAGVHPALVDLAFVLAFLFLILSTLAETNPQSTQASESSLPPIHLPELDTDGKTSPGVSTTTETLSLLADGSLLVGDRAVADLEACGDILQSSGVSAVSVRAEAEVAYGRVADLLALCQKLGVDEVSLTYEQITQTKDSL